MSEISIVKNPNIEPTRQTSFVSSDLEDEISQFHRSLPGYLPTPLVALNQKARSLGIASLHVKDESKRFDLNAFKILGASYAMAKILSDVIKVPLTRITFDEIIRFQADYANLTFATATDGNHGRAVAWMAKLFGCKSVVYLPHGTSPRRLSAIKAYGADACITEYNYDDTVKFAQAQAKLNDWVLLQDTAWEGYDVIPKYIMQGYYTLAVEIFESADIWPSHVFLQAGVGSFPAAIAAYFEQRNDMPKPKIVIVEPDAAPCLYESIRLNEIAKIEGALTTLMAGLACGEPSSLALDILRDAAFAFIKCADSVTITGMKMFAEPLSSDEAIVSGESGAVTYGLVHALLSNPEHEAATALLELNSKSNILLISTEGNTDPDVYSRIVAN